MAVRKIAVIALIVIIATPILMGYALNLTETTETDYKASGNPVNVTQLLQNDTIYTTTDANIYDINTNFSQNGVKIYPVYQQITATKSSFKSNMAYVDNDIIYTGAYITSYALLSYMANYTPSLGYVTMYYTLTDNTTGSIQYFHSLDYDYTNNIATITYYTSDTTVSSLTINNLSVIDSFSKTGTFIGNMYVLYDFYNESYYVDLSKGFRLYGSTNKIILPQNTRSLTLTINLDSITAANYSFLINGYVMEKTTVSSVVHWKIYPQYYPGSGFELYYNSGISNNTYQILIQNSETEYDSSLALPYKSTRHMELRYVGNWPTLFGEANYYQTYSFPDSNVYSLYDNVGLDEILINTSNYSPVMRVDAAQFRGYESASIVNNTYNPADFKTNPVTTISGISKYGSSLIFGSNTYNVSKEGKITINGHDVPVKDLVFSSIPNDLGSYDNKIGNTLISTSATPSTITFKGIWAASVSTDSMEQYSYTHTEWNVGKFAWDGIDQNFLIVGLVTCLGVFVALGIYARKSRSGGIIPLMIVTGCAAAVFFIML